MAKIRIHELAKELDKQSKDIQTFLQQKGIEVKSASSSVEEEIADTVRKAFGKVQAKTEEIKEKAVKETKKKREKVKTVFLKLRICNSVLKDKNVLSLKKSTTWKIKFQNLRLI